MPREVDVYVGWRIRQRRMAIGMTQMELAGKVGVRFQQIQKYETGANRVSASRLWDIASVLEVPVSYFFREAESATRCAEDGFSEVLADRDWIELMRAYRVMPEKQRQGLLGLVRVIADHANAPIEPLSSAA